MYGYNCDRLYYIISLFFLCLNFESWPSESMTLLYESLCLSTIQPHTHMCAPEKGIKKREIWKYLLFERNRDLKSERKDEANTMKLHQKKTEIAIWNRHCYNSYFAFDLNITLLHSVSILSRFCSIWTLLLYCLMSLNIKHTHTQPHRHSEMITSDCRTQTLSQVQVARCTRFDILSFFG